tara:strand:+ start:362 stop:1039 length:678 start_codon:yes stop_codon:yes gene_type:complete
MIFKKIKQSRAKNLAAKSAAKQTDVNPILTDRVKPIELDEVEVKVLSKESEANLSQPERFIYDKYKIQDQDGIGLKNARLRYKTGHDGRRDVDAFQAMNLVKDSGVKKINDKPSFFSNFFSKTMNIKKNRRGDIRSFRPHANPSSREIYVKQPSLDRTMDDVFAESAHMPKYENPHTGILGLGYGAYKMLTGKQKEMYNEPGNYEHYTHEVIEPKLANKYSTKRK